MLVPQGKGSDTPTEPHHTSSPEAQQTSSTTPSSPTLPSITTAPISIVTPSNTPTLMQHTRRARIAQSSALPPIVDKPASPLRDVSECEACPTDSGFEADQDRANIAKSSTLPHDSAPRVPSPAADEGNMRLKLDELTALCTSLQRQHSEMVAKFNAQDLEIHRLKAKVKLLEGREGVVAERYRDDALIKGRNLDEGEALAESVSDDTEEMATVLTSMDAATVLSGRVAEVPTGSGSIPTAGPPAAEVPTGSDVVPTAGPIFATATVIARIHAEEELQIIIEGLDRSNETIAMCLQEYHQFALELPIERRIKLISDLVRYQDYYAKIDIQMARQLEEEMEREYQRMNEKIARDAKIARIHAEEELQIIIEGLDRSNETIAMCLQEYHQFALELPIERRIELISDLVRYQDYYAKVHKYQTQQRNLWSKKQKRDYYIEVIKSNLGWKVKDFRGMTFEEIEAKFTTVWKQIKNFIPMGSKEEAERFKRKGIRFEQENDEDQLWTHTQNLMHAPVEWKLYDMCGVHHVSSKDKEIFMLVEKDYPLRKGLAIGMISYKLQGRIVRNKMHKAFPLPKEVPNSSEESSHCQKKRLSIAVKIALLLKSRRNSPIIEDWVSDSEDDSEAEIPQNALSFVQPTKQLKPPRPSVKPVENSTPAANNKTTIPKLKSHGNNKNRKACFVPRPTKTIVTKPHSPPRRNINHRLSPKASTFPLKVIAAKASMVNDVKGNWVWKPKCQILDHVSRHLSASMTLKRHDLNEMDPVKEDQNELSKRSVGWKGGSKGTQSTVFNSRAFQELLFDAYIVFILLPLCLPVVVVFYAKSCCKVLGKGKRKHMSA
nr:hypothetical protein [Tanacetum cinerariifolium]